MIRDDDGAQIIDADGHAIGTVERSYVDDRGDVRFVEVKIGTLRTRHRLIPVDDASQTSAGLRVPYTKQVIEDSPDVSSLGDNLTGDTLEQVRSYYAGDSTGMSDGGQAAVAVPATTEDTEPNEGIGGKLRERLQDAGDTVRGALHRHDHDDDTTPAIKGTASSGVVDKGDVVEIPIVEEQLVKQPVVTEVLRVRKTPETERRIVSADVRKEDVEVVQEGEADVHGYEDRGP